MELQSLWENLILLTSTEQIQSIPIKSIETIKVN